MTQLRHRRSVISVLADIAKEPGRSVLLDNVKFDLCSPGLGHVQFFGRRKGDINYSPGNERASVIDPNYHGSAISDVSHPQSRAEWQRWVSSCKFIRIERFTIRG